MSISVLTRGYDNARTGANTAESQLIAQAVGTRGIKRLFSLNLPGDRRGAEAQPLIVPGVKLHDGRTIDLVLIGTMANQVFAFNAEDGSQVWARTLGTPIQDTQAIDEYRVNDHWGILATPVIDATAGVMYLCAWISADGSVAKARHSLHALRITDGADVHPGLDFEGASYNPGHGRAVQTFASAARKQRSSLLLVGGTVFVAFASVQETSRDARGWIIACDTRSWAITAAWAAAADGFGGGIWQGGSGIAADRQGHIYCMTGNGTFDAETDWAESFLKLEYKAPAGGRQGSLTVVDWWTPWTDDARTGLDRSGDELSTPSPTNRRAYTIDVNEGWEDMDIGSGGPVLVEAHGLVVGAGKDGILYVVKANDMGKTRPADLDHPHGNYGKLAAPPIWFTFFPGFDVNPAPDDISTLNQHFFQKTHHQHAVPVLWQSTEHGLMLFCWGENANLRAWTLSAGGVATYLACSAEVASAQAPDQFGGMPGGMLCLSANGTEPHTGIVWACIPYGNANTGDGNTGITWGRLLAYDATTFGRFGDGSAQLRVLWDSQDWNLSFPFCKFTPPVVANGKLFVSTYGGRVDVYGLA
jgi:outer membrane protein assembly factor BamB